ncbi:DUF2867 domain-containing protein [Rhodopseudomonas sp. P2A-2r]|uniref:DUF2867 domain-containing protein n=1 Tax=unclassified Rhodopseudomonas TaxID=2638247 RepID=UPI0022345874|nr:DUF2867 domain-containing protein [Rhodopseudomonas sp. P2A-2r]UZE49397.1 DUF2867 domain-containing protein [Rhodopseudomonas sp. P2A-2r]
MSVQAIAPPADARTFLPGAQFADAFTLTVRDPALDARGAAQRLFGTSPGWVRALLVLRDAIVAPFGITTSQTAARAPVDRVGMFPVVSDTPQRLVAGFNDVHLDFRVLVDVAPAQGGTRITVTTVVLTHNWLGRCYLTVILPFHRLVARAALSQAAG